MPYYNEQDLEDFVDYLNNDTQTEDLNDFEDEIEEIEMDEEAMNVKFFEETREKSQQRTLRFQKNGLMFKNVLFVASYPILSKNQTNFFQNIIIREN
jgi:uncharacterized membrane protein YcjF (UPF0283 family)